MSPTERTRQYREAADTLETYIEALNEEWYRQVAMREEWERDMIVTSLEQTP